MNEWIVLEVSLDISRHQSVLVHKDSDSYKLFLKWKDDPTDSNWEELAEYISDDVKDDMEFYIEDIRE